MSRVEKPQGLGSTERLIFAGAVSAVLGAIAVAMLTAESSVQRFFDNMHWTLAYSTGAWLAWLGVRKSGDADPRPRKLLAYALTTYAVGQVLWDVQVATGWNPFPGPSDAFFLCLGPLSGLGLIGILNRETNASQRKLITLDVAGLTIAVLALTLALYLPKRGDQELLPLAVLVAYPVVLCWAACVGVISALTLALTPRSGWLLHLGALLVNSFLWLTWNALTLDGALEDGSWLNALFSVAAIAQGLGALWWRVERAHPDGPWARSCAAALRLMPLAIVCVVALTVVLVDTLHAPNIVRWVAWIGGGLVVLLASLRQSVLIGEHEQLIRTERALRETQAVYRVLFDQATDGIFMSDARGRYIDTNPRAAELLGMKREEIIGLTIADIVAPDERARVPSALAELATGATHRQQWRFARKDGTTFLAEVGAKMLSDGRLLGTVHDVSERLALEAQLRQAQKMEAVGTLAAGIAHDFNNLIAVILGNAQLAAQRLGDRERTARGLDEILTASKRAAELVRQIVAFSRPREPVKAVVKLPQAVEEVARLLRSTLPAGAELVLSIDRSVPDVQADPTQLHQVLVNLATNAWQAMEGGTGTITIALERTQLGDSNTLGLGSGEYVCLSVADTGKGMDAQTCERIFEPFFTTKPVGEGTGLGLAIVHRIVSTHGGAIGVESQPRHGSKFKIVLPAVRAHSARGEGAGHQGVASSTPSLRVMYVDDETALVSLMKRHLEQRGHHVRGFTSSEEALSAVISSPYGCDLLVTDYNMPKLSGLDLMARARALRSDLPLVLTSGSVDPELTVRAEGLDVHCVLHKPYSLDDLDRVIAEVAKKLANRPATVALRAQPTSPSFKLS